MGILVKKKQQGGSIYGDPRYLVLNADFPMQMPSSGGSPRAIKPTAPSTSKGKGKDFTGFLQSDIDYYWKKDAAIKQSLREGLDKHGDNFDDMPEFKTLMAEKDQLERVFYPAMKNHADMYKKNIQVYNSNSVDAGDEPAIVNGQAIVYSKPDQTYKVVGVEDLLTNAGDYQLMKGSNVVNLRQKDYRFSANTPAGQIADQILGNAYGHTVYNEQVDKAVKIAGYNKEPGRFIGPGGQILNLDDLKFNENGTFLTKTNVPQLNALRRTILSDDSNMTNYLEGRAISNLYKGIRKGSVKMDEGTDVNKLLNRSIDAQLASTLTNKIYEEQSNLREKEAGSGKIRKYKGNYPRLAMVTMFNATTNVEVPKSINEDDNVSTMINSMPAAFVYKGADYLNDGYGDDNKTDEDDGANDFNRRTLANNTIIMSDVLAGESLISTANGMPLNDLVEDKNDLQEAIIPKKDPKLHVMLAPVITRPDGKQVVNFQNDYNMEMIKAIENTYARLSEEGITSQDVMAGDVNIVKRAAEISREELRKVVGDVREGVPEIRAVYAFKVQYEANAEAEEDPNAGWTPKDGGDELYNILSESKYWKRPKETFVFAPISLSYWSAIQTPESVEEDLRYTVDSDLVQGIRMSSPLVTKKYTFDKLASTIAERMKTKKKKQGGKLQSSDELINLLFN